MLPRLLLFVYFSFIVCEDNDVNYENLRRFMSQSPEDLAKTLQLLENPYVAAALVNGNKKQKQKSQPMEEKNPALPLVPPVVHAKGLENDPLLGSFFQDAREDLPPLENAKNINVPTVENDKSERQTTSEQYKVMGGQSDAYYYVPPSHFQ